MLSHYIAFLKCPCLNFIDANIEHIFANFLHNMVDYNIKNSIVELFFSTYIVRF
jgi:hypothetical protein